MNEKLAHLEWCLEQLELAGPEAHAGQVLWAELPSLLASPEVARELVQRLAALDEAPDEEPPEGQLLEILLDEARRAGEDDRPEGSSFRDAADHACQAMAIGATTTNGLIRLARAYNRAGLAAPAAATTAQAQHLDAETAASGASPDETREALAAHLNQAIAEAGDDLYQVYSRISEALAGIPDHGGAAFIHEIARWSDRRISSLCTYWVLDPRAELARAAAEALSEMATAGELDDGAAGRLAWVRNALPEGALREVVTTALETYRSDNRTWPGLRTAGEPDVAFMSVPDGAGVQLVAIGERRDGDSRWSLILVKAGHGIRDAYTRSGFSGDEEAAFLEQLFASSDLCEVSMTAVDTLLAAAVAENQGTNHNPPPGLLDVARATGLRELRPQRRSCADWLSLLDPAGELDRLTANKRGRLINQSGEWIDQILAPDFWFEDNASVREILAAGGSNSSLQQRLRAYLDERRGWWAELFLRGALATAETGPDGLSRSMTVTARALLEGRPIRRIPIMEQIAEATLQAYSEGDAIEPSDAERERGLGDIMLYPDAYRETLQPWFDDTSSHGAWSAGYYGIHGYMFAVATHPDVIRPAEWMGQLFGDPDAGGLVFQGKDDVDRFMTALMGLYNTINGYVLAGQAALPEGAAPAPEAAADMRADSPIRQWAQGFCVAAETFGHLLERTEADYGADSDVAASVATAMNIVQMLAFPDDATHALREVDVSATPEQAVSAALHELPLYLPLLSVAASTYRALNDYRTQTDSVAPVDDGLHERPQPARSQKVGRNEPCPCGSGKKYKKCCRDATRAR
ncbi:MAG: UPF0149 family protein [Ectothiorhodospiraceae bacterium]